MMPLEKTLNFNFQDKSLLEWALIHPSYYSGKPSTLDINHFERLEFLGDRVLGLIIANLLFKTFPTATEGELARRHANLVCKEALTEVAQNLGIDHHLKYSRSNDNNPTQWITLLSDTMEAVIGAVYIDGGYEPANTFVSRHWSALLTTKGLGEKDPKTTLQEWVQSRLKVLPTYTLVYKKGPAHAPEIKVECHVQTHTVSAVASSKKLAEIACAKEMLTRLQVKKTQ